MLSAQCSHGSGKPINVRRSQTFDFFQAWEIAHGNEYNFKRIWTFLIVNNCS